MIFSRNCRVSNYGDYLSMGTFDEYSPIFETMVFSVGTLGICFLFILNTSHAKYCKHIMHFNEGIVILCPLGVEILLLKPICVIFYLMS